MKNQSAKRVNIVSLKLVKESSILYKKRCVRSPEEGYQLLERDRIKIADGSEDNVEALSDGRVEQLFFYVENRKKLVLVTS